YMGETPKIVNMTCDKAMGGILFVDEAYSLSEGNDSYGKEAIDTLMKRMEDDRGKFVVIVAGYQDKMEAFLATNPGLNSRFTHHLHIADYTDHELMDIFKKMAAVQLYQLTLQAEVKLIEVINNMCVNKSASFGNARDIRNLFETTIQQLSIRVSKMPVNEITKETYQIILPEDIVINKV
ncbi:MAG: AAA family ATPase, partial [Bacteroidaceae bacterium]|nr:AAA family ATPase [Bacteroidaceae bacterium]